MVTGDKFFDIMNSLAKEFSIDNQCIDNPTYSDYADNNF
jgi:hypothetical protein